MLQFIIFTVYTVIAFAYSEIITWTKTFGGKEYDGAKSVEQTEDGGYILAGYTYSFRESLSDLYILKLDKNGNKVFEKRFEGKGTAGANCVRRTKDSGYIVVGYTKPPDEKKAYIYLIKLDKVGNVEWEKIIGGKYTLEANSIEETKDNGYIIVGNRYSPNTGFDVYVLKLDAFGNKVWKKTYGGKFSDSAYSVKQTPDDGYIVVGYTYLSKTYYDFYVLKLDRNGNKIWEKTFGSEKYEEAYDVLETQDGSYIVVGNIEIPGGGVNSIYAIKLDKTGKKVWEKTYKDCRAYSIQPAQDNGYIIVGDSRNPDLTTDICILKIDLNGNKEWSKIYGDAQNDGAKSVKQTKDGGYIVVGYTESFSEGKSDIYVLKLDSQGNLKK